MIKGNTLVATLAVAWALHLCACSPRQKIELTDGDDDITPDEVADTDADLEECVWPCGDGCCTEGERCIDGICCPEDDVCVDQCCGEDEVCEVGSCHIDCGGDVRCGDPGEPEECCAWPEVCYLGLCHPVGDPCLGDGDCPPEEYCEPTLGYCMPRSDDVECDYMPPTGEFEPVEEWSWNSSTVGSGYDQSVALPVVASLNDDNGDTVVDENDIPDIIFTCFSGDWYYQNAVLRAISGDGSGELFSLDSPEDRVIPTGQLAVGDIDSDGLNEIVACSDGPATRGQVVVFENDGTRKWTSSDSRVMCFHAAPFIANLDKIDDPEIIIRYTVLDSSGSVVWSNEDDPCYRPAGPSFTWYHCENNFSTAADIDLDGYLDVVGGNVVYSWDGSLIWERPDLPDGFPAVANLDGDTGEFADAEIAVVSVVYEAGGWSDGPHELRVMDSDGSVLWGPVDINPPGFPTPDGPEGGGPPTIADFDGDDRPEIGLAGGYGYVVFNGEDGSLLWFQPTTDRSSRRTGSSVFDFEGDGVAEVVYNDEYTLRIYSGTDGAVLWDTCNTSATLFEYPLIVDVDRDDHAEIVVVANDYDGSWTCSGGSHFHGIRVFGDALNNWVRTRPIWNQHTYHVTNVEVDGSIPTDEEPNWLVEEEGVVVLNNFRQNVQTSGLHAAPDLVPRDLGVRTVACPEIITITARVLNQGSAGVLPGANVAFYEGDPAGAHTLVAVVSTTRTLLPGTSELLEVEWTIPDERRIPHEVFSFYVVVDDDGTGTGNINECHEDNNQAGPLLTECPGVY